MVASLPIRPVLPAPFLDVLQGWGHTWLWNKMKVLGDTDWLLQATAGGMLIVVTDGSYIQEHYPDLCSAAFILECTQGGGHAAGAFSKTSIDANAFQEELLGLMAMHLLLLAVNTVSPGLTGWVQVYSDCLGALSPVSAPSLSSSITMQALQHSQDNPSELRWANLQQDILPCGSPSG